MKKRKRRVWFILVAVLIAAVGVVAYFETRENPDYVRAAKRLPEAQARASEAFGPFTWEEYREENGIIVQDDSDEWKRIVISIPPDLEEFRDSDALEPTKRAELFTSNRGWLLSVAGDTEKLAVHQLYPASYSAIEFFSTKSLMQALAVGIGGAADVGDVDAVNRLGWTAWDILEKFTVEMDGMHAVIIETGRPIVIGALLGSVARNPEKEDLAATAKMLIEQSPKLPAFRKAFAGGVRGVNDIIDLIQDPEMGGLDETLDALRVDFDPTPPGPASNPSFSGKVREFFMGLSNRNPDRRGTGEHTVAALEARLLEVEVVVLTLSEEVLRTLPYSMKRLERFEHKLAARTDLSYELAQQFVSAGQAQLWMRHEISQSLSLLAVEIMAGHSTVQSLPESLPESELTPDPFGAGLLHYTRTATGFIVYTVYEDGIDGGFAIADTYSLDRRNASFAASDQSADFGIVVNYKIPMASPVPESIWPR